MNETIRAYVDANQMDSFLNEDLLAHLRLFRFAAYQLIYIEQDEQHYLYFLVEGQVQCYHYQLNGKLAVLSLTDPFAVIGEFEIFDEEQVRTNVLATQDTVMLGIARDVVRRYGAEDPKFLRFLIDELRGKLFRANRLQTSHVLPVASRVALYILSQAGDAADRVTLPAKEAMASMMGVTTRHLNRVLKDMVEEGVIEEGYPVVAIRDRNALEGMIS